MNRIQEGDEFEDRNGLFPRNRRQVAGLPVGAQGTATS
jgi:hypothetical protein